MRAMKRSRFILLAVAVSAIALGLVWKARLSEMVRTGGLTVVRRFDRTIETFRGDSCFEFVNRSDRTVDRLELEFAYVTTSGTNGAAGLTRHYTNVIPGASVTVRFHTPELMMTSLFCVHRPAIFHYGDTTIEGPWWSAHSDAVVARPGATATICFDSPGNLKIANAK